MAPVPGRAAIGLVLALGLGALAAGCGGPLSSPDTGVGCSVTVQIPAFNSAPLGTVQATYHGSSHLLTRNESTIQLACGQKAVLSATAASAAQHPFTGWTVAGHRLSPRTVTVVADGLITATPSFYVRATPPASPSVSPSAEPSVSASAKPSPSSSTVSLDRWLSYNAATKTATLELVAGYQGVNNTLSYDGEANGKLVVTVPVGWTTVVNFSNVDKINHSAAIVTAGGTTPVFPGASIPNPTVGIPPGSHSTFSFVASRTGSYRIACLVLGHEQLGMWATFDVTASGLPTIHL
ncbi:MAG: sulfocyanin-like copper-binding protein [Candidatus Dormibacteria bacterium]